MRYFILKILAIFAILFLMCLPFFPGKFRFSLASPTYKGKDRWRNIAFVLETMFLGLFLLIVAPYIKSFFKWFFGLSFMEWLVDLIPERFVYTVDVITIILVNLAVCFLFLIIKKVFRSFLDVKVYKQVSGSDKKKDKKKNKKTKKQIDSDNEKRLRKLKRESVLVFGGNGAEGSDKRVMVSDYRIEKDPPGKAGNKLKKAKEEDSETIKDLVKLLCFKFIGIFYDKEDDYEYVRPGAYRFAKELSLFIALIALFYLVVFFLVLIPVFFSFSELSGFYAAAQWIVGNTYLYPIFSIILICEIFWFVNGEYKDAEEPEAVFTSFVDGVKGGETVDLAEVKDSILEKYAGNYSIKNFSTTVRGAGAYNIGDKKLHIQNIAKSIRVNSGYVNGDYMQSMEYMFDGKHVLFDSSLYSSLGEYILHYLFVTLSFGKRALFICKDKKETENVRSYLEQGFGKITKTSQILWRINTLKEMHEGEKPDILLLIPEEFLDDSLFVDGRDFFEDLEDVFVIDADKIITANNYYCLIMAKKLEKATTSVEDERSINGEFSVAVNKRLRYSFFSCGHVQSLDNSIHQFFNLGDDKLETFHSFGLASKTEIFVWHTGISSTLYVDNGANQVALEVQIAKDVSTFGIPDINLISDSAVYSSQLNEIPGLTLNSCAISNNSIGYVIVADDHFNLPSAIYNYSRFSGRENSVLHVVSKPYLLRDYFTSRAESYVAHFELIGKTMSEHARAKKANTIILLCDAVNGIERSEFIRRASLLVGDKNSPLELDECVKLCYEAAFDTDADDTPKYSLKTERNSEFREKTFVYLKDHAKLFAKLLECTETVKLEFVNTQSEEQLPIFKDEITQHFVPGQVLVRNNHVYTIKEMSVEDGVLVLDDTVPSVNVPMDYIQTRIYTVRSAELVHSFGHDYRAKNCIVSHMEFSVYNANIVADTTGYYSIEKAMQTVDLAKPNFAKYIDLSNDKDLMAKIQRNINTKMLVVELSMNEESDPHHTYLLSVILHELMKTVFPHQYRCVSVCPLFDGDCEKEFFENEIAIRDLYPRIAGKFEGNSSASEKGRIRFAVIEDIQNGNGIVDTLVDGNGIIVTNLLHIAADFLEWLQSPEGKSYKYLNFGYDELPEVFDIEKLEPVIKQFRHEVERSEFIRANDDNRCFFCHKILDPEEGQKLEDDRMICRDCIDSTVNTFEELRKCFDSVLAAVKESTSVPETFPEDIDVDFVSTLELRERYGEDAEKLPVAYCNHVTKCIYLEYGLPKVALCAAIARMITELWQDHNTVGTGSELYLAHPDLVEIQTLAALKYTSDAQVLSDFYKYNAGLRELQDILNGLGNQDSFAYFLGTVGKQIKKDPVGEIEGEGEISFVADRDPKDLPRFYYNRLSEDEKAVYDQIYEAISNMAESTGSPVREIEAKACQELVWTVLYDNAEIFWCANPPNAVATGSDGMVNNIIFKYVMTPSELRKRKKKIEKAIAPFLKGIKESMSDYEVALKVHENIIDLIDYDSIGLDIQDKDPDSNNKPDDLRSIYGVFVEEKAVCAGYARAFQYMLNRLGIECAYVRGQCLDGVWHAWNIIKLEGDYYYVDVTFDDRTNTDERKNGSGEVSYDYFGITTEELLKSRSINKAETYPECNAVKCNYFVRSRLFFADYDAAKLRKHIISELKAGKKEVAFKFENKDVLELARERLITSGGIYDIVHSLDENKKKVSLATYCNDEMNILHIIIK